MKNNFLLIVEPHEQQEYENIKHLIGVDTSLEDDRYRLVVSSNYGEATICSFDINKGYDEMLMLSLETLRLALLLRIKYSNLGYTVEIKFTKNSFSFEAQNEEKDERLILKRIWPAEFETLDDMQRFYQHAIKTVDFY